MPTITCIEDLRHRKVPRAFIDFSRDEAVSIGSDRSLGLVMATWFTVFASFRLWREGRAWPPLATIAVFFLVTALLVPIVLNPLNRAWLKLGLLLHKIVDPVVMGLVFYGAVLPTGLVMRAMGRDLLPLKPQPKAESYWIVRTPLARLQNNERSILRVTTHGVHSGALAIHAGAEKVLAIADPRHDSNRCRAVSCSRSKAQNCTGLPPT